MRVWPEWIGQRLARYLSRPRDIGFHPATSPPGLVEAALRPGDAIDPPGFVGDRRTLIEADVNEGVRAVPFSLYAGYHTRICRPVGLSHDVTMRVCDYMISRLGYRYDMRNVFDLARYLIQRPPVPGHWKRRMLALGSGDPTRAICSSLIAQAFQSIRYPVLPHVEPGTHPEVADEIHHIRHHSLFAPRDFDVSPYFDVIKPRVEAGFDYREIVWDDRTDAGMTAGDR